VESKIESLAHGFANRNYLCVADEVLRSVVVYSDLSTRHKRQQLRREPPIQKMVWQRCHVFDLWIPVRIGFTSSFRVAGYNPSYHWVGEFLCSDEMV